MKWSRSDHVRFRRVFRHAYFAACCVVLLCWAGLACRNEAEEPALAPELLHDQAEMARYLEAFPADRFEIVEVRNVGKFYIDDNPTLVKRVLRKGRPWAPHLLSEFRKHVVPGTTVLDVGAHIGSLTVPLARLVGPEGRVYAFEPQKHVYRELVYNLRLNELDNATPLRFAVSSEPGIIEMTPVFVDDGWGHIGKGGDEAEARTIDSFGFSDVSVIKIDVEGHEAEVLKGAEETVGTFHPVIFVEIRPSNVQVVKPILKGWGYSLQRLPSVAMDYVAIFGPSRRRR